MASTVRKKTELASIAGIIQFQTLVHLVVLRAVPVSQTSSQHVFHFASTKPISAQHFGKYRAKNAWLCYFEVQLL